MDSRNSNEFEFNLKSLFDVINQFGLWILLATVLFGALAAIYTEIFIDPTYSTSISFYVKDSESSLTQTSQQYSAAETHVYSSMAILSAGECRKTLGISGKGVSLGASKKSDTPMFVVKVSGTDRYTVLEVAEIIRDELPSYVFSKTQTGSLNVYDFTGLDMAADGPNTAKNVAIAAIIGFILSFGIFFLRITLDTTIHSEENIKNNFTYPILGTIPTMIEEVQAAGAVSNSKK